MLFRFKTSARLRRGFSLVEVMVAVGVLGVLCYGFASIVTHQFQQTRALSEVLSKTELERTLIGVFANGQVCTHVLSDPSQASTATPPNRYQDTLDMGALATEAIRIRRLPNSAVPGAPILAEEGRTASLNSESLIVSDIRFENIRAFGVSQVQADMKVTFDATRTVRPLRPISLTNIIIDVNSADPVGARRLTGCTPPRGPMPKLRRYTFTAADGVLTNDPANGSYSTITWVVPAGVESGFITMAGGGGSGAGYRVANAIFSGHSGGYVFSHVANFTPGETLTIRVGLGGVAHPPLQKMVGGVPQPVLFNESGGPITTPGIYFVYERPLTETGSTGAGSAEVGIGGYPGGTSKITNGSGDVLVECAGGSGLRVPVDVFVNNDLSGAATTAKIPGDLSYIYTGSGSHITISPSRVAAGPYARSASGRCGPNPSTSYGEGNDGMYSFMVSSGYYPGGTTPFGYGTGGAVGVSGCFITPGSPGPPIVPGRVGTCVFQMAGRDGVVFIDVMY